MVNNLTGKLLDRFVDRVVVDPGQAHLDLLRQVLPVLPVVHGAVVQRPNPGERIRQDLVQGETDDVNEAHLHLGQLVLALPGSKTEGRGEIVIRKHLVRVVNSTFRHKPVSKKDSLMFRPNLLTLNRIPPSKPTIRHSTLESHHPKEESISHQ